LSPPTSGSGNSGWGIHQAILLYAAAFSWRNTVLAAGMTFVILTGGIDLSVGSILAASSMLGLIVSLVPNYSFLGFEACLFTGLVLGLTNGALIAFLRLPPFIVTLGSLTAVRGVARLFSNDRTVFNSDLSFAFIGSSEICWTWNDSLDFVIAKQSILCIVGNVLSALGLT
jgi:ribose transport system permease protein